MDKREKIYRLLIHGFSAIQIIKKIKVSKGYISRIIKELEQGGYILCINPNSKPRFYVKTKKDFTSIKFPSTIPDKYTRLSHRLDMVEIQKSSYICNVIVKPTKAKWDSEYQWRPGVSVQQYSHPFKDFGVVRFRRIVSKNKDRIIIILPRICLHKSEVGSADEMLLDYAVKAGKWIKKKFDMPVSMPEICQKPHYAVSAKEPEIVKAIDDASFNINGMMADKSLPDLIPEIESTDSRDIVNYLDSIRKIKSIEEQLLNNRKAIQSILDKMETLGENQEGIISILDTLTKPQTISKKDSYRDVV